MNPWRRLIGDHPQSGLAALLVALTFVSGTVDAVSFLSLGHVFVAAMTGNLLFVAFALAGKPGFSIVAALVALVAFIAGSVLGGTLVKRAGSDPRTVVAHAAAAQLVAMAIGALVLGLASAPGAVAARLLVALLGLAMGAQMTAVRSAGVSEITTTVLTTTLSRLVAELREAGTFSPSARLSTTAILTEVLGALAGALLVRDVAGWTALALGACCAALVTVAAVPAGPRASTGSR